MTRNMPVLGLVPARAGSKGIVGKNMRLIDGDPMIAHTLKAARESGVIDRLVVSTEGNEIAQWCTLQRLRGARPAGRARRATRSPSPRWPAT